MSYFFVCVLLLLSDFNMLDCTVFVNRDMLVAQVALCHLFEINYIAFTKNLTKSRYSEHILFGVIYHA